MSNIKNYNFNKIDFKLSNSDYYDFFLNTEGDADVPHYDTNNIASFDFSTYTTLDLSGITSTTQWINYLSSNFSATTYGLTGLDNGDILYDPTIDDDAHTALLSALTGTTLIGTSNDTKLVLKQVSGSTNWVYPIELVTTGTTTYLNLSGGFYQGYYKLDGIDYQTLPNRYERGFTISTWLNRSTTDYPNTLNVKYPDNKGVFFYMGTRAENKFWNIFTGNTMSACTSGSTDFCMDIKEINVEINNIIVENEVSNVTVPLSPPPMDIRLVDNKFLIFGRSSGISCSNGASEDGFGQMRASDYDRNIPFYSRITRQEQTETRNPFLIFGRSSGISCSNGPSEDGYGQVRATDYSGFTSDVLELDKNADIIDNAIGFRIRDDGTIGYRILTLSADCKSVEMIEEYSELSGITVPPDQWAHVAVKWVNNDTYSACDLINGDVRKGKLKFYLNSMLIFVSKELNEFIGKRLYDLQEKQIGVPYNISIGGGTQGLLESMTFDGQDPDDLGLMIESNFAGSFIGYISDFNIYDKNLSWCQLKDIYIKKQNNFI